MPQTQRRPTDLRFWNQLRLCYAPVTLEFDCLTIPKSALIVLILMLLYRKILILKSELDVPILKLNLSRHLQPHRSTHRMMFVAEHITHIKELEMQVSIINSKQSFLRPFSFRRKLYVLRLSHDNRAIHLFVWEIASTHIRRKSNI